MAAPIEVHTPIAAVTTSENPSSCTQGAAYQHLLCHSCSNLWLGTQQCDTEGNPAPPPTKKPMAAPTEVHMPIPAVTMSENLSSCTTDKQMLAYD